MSVTLTSVERINALKNGIEATTGETYADLTAGVQALKNGYGQGGGGGTEEIENLIDQSGVLGTTDGTVTVTEKVEQLIEKAEWEKFWYEQSGKWTSNFSTNVTFFKGATAFPRLNFENITVMRQTFMEMSAETIDYYINCGKAYELSRLFQNCNKLKFIYGIDMSNCANCQYCFNVCSSLETIQEPLDFSKVTNNASCFNGCTALKNIRFLQESIKVSITIPSPVLSKESISGEQGIINGLNSEVTGQTLTIPRNAVKKAFETSEGANNGDESAEWLSLKDSKSNWTITLS